MNNPENIQVVRRAYENFQAGDIAALLGQMSDDVVWDFLEIENVPFAGRKSGIAGVTEFFQQLNKSQEALVFNPTEFVSNGEKVVALGNYRWRVKSNGREYGGDWAHVFTIRDGKITGFKEFMDTAGAAAAHAA